MRPALVMTSQLGWLWTIVTLAIARVAAWRSPPTQLSLVRPPPVFGVFAWPPVTPSSLPRPEQPLAFPAPTPHGGGVTVPLSQVEEPRRDRTRDADQAEARRQEHHRRVDAEQRAEIAGSLRDLLAMLNAQRPFAEALRYIVHAAGNLLGSEAAAIYGLERVLEASPAHIQTEPLTLQAAESLGELGQVSSPLPFAHAAVRKALAARWPVMVQQRCVPPAGVGEREDRAAAESGIPMQLLQAENLPARHQALLVVPLAGRDEAYGCLLLFYSAPCQFAPEDMALAMTYADQVAQVIANARLQARIERDAVEAERHRLASDLHDTVSQEIFSASLLSETIAQLWRKHRREAEQGLKQLHALTSGAVAALRMLLLERHPASLEQLPLADSLRQLAEGMSVRARVRIQLQLTGEKLPLPAEVKLAFYRVAREALTNAAKHADAHTITVRLRIRRTGTSALEIVDDGRGFDPDAVPAGHFGLAMMREHAHDVGAVVRINGREGAGTQVVMEWRRTRAKSTPHRKSRKNREEAARAPVSADPRRDRG